jgi:hypothetical protein
MSCISESQFLNNSLFQKIINFRKYFIDICDKLPQTIFDCNLVCQDGYKIDIYDEVNEFDEDKNCDKDDDKDDFIINIDYDDDDD